MKSGEDPRDEFGLVSRGRSQIHPKWGQPPQTRSIVCYRCGKEGHIARLCQEQGNEEGTLPAPAVSRYENRAR
ncbi:Hypothetical protein FKW44_004529 [Caligus rogercresseyi]|uniref:CCHC-type domain-containing protein n=1 Tax=Caligus rogercresseyi TaxID=217165 RepID=A0A7T8HM21_CALRO|nr:Hypothetical protein FKW44_004529 [Caligus rogercresseyi]